MYNSRHMIVGQAWKQMFNGSSMHLCLFMWHVKHQIQVMEDDKRNRCGVFHTGQKGTVPPLVTTDFVVEDQGILWLCTNIYVVFRDYVELFLDLLICSSWCHCHSLTRASVKSRLVLLFWYRLTRVVPDKGPLNVCVCQFLQTTSLMMELCRYMQSSVSPIDHVQYSVYKWFAETDACAICSCAFSVLPACSWWGMSHCLLYCSDYGLQELFSYCFLCYVCILYDTVHSSWHCIQWCIWLVPFHMLC